MDSLPVELTFAIFLKVPTKGIGQSMLVSKKWLSHIKNPYFISSYISNNRLLVSQKLERISFNFDNQEFDCYKSLEPPFEPDCWWDCLKGISNGILCMVNVIGSIVLWNPTIQKTLTLPHLPNNSNNVVQTLSPGLVFDSSTNDYKVVTYVDDMGYKTESCYLQVFSLHRNSWRTDHVIIPTHIRYSLTHKDSLSFNSVLYWIASDVDHRQIILGYDVSTEIVREMKLPEIVEYANVATMFVYTESTVGLCYFTDRDMVIWVMKDGSSWIKIWTLDVVARFNLEEVYYSLAFCFKMGSTNELFLQITWKEDSDEEPDDDDEIETERMIMLLDMEKGEQKFVVRDAQVVFARDAELLFGKRISYFVESLVLLDHPSAQNCILADH